MTGRCDARRCDQQDIDHKRLHWVVEAAEEYAAENR